MKTVNDAALRFQPTDKVIDLFNDGRLISALERSFKTKTDLVIDEFRSNDEQLFYIGRDTEHSLMIRAGRDYFEIDYDVKGQLVFKVVYEVNTTAHKRSYYWRSSNLHDYEDMKSIMKMIGGQPYCTV